MEGHNVLFPIGWDAFGAPAEQYAIKNHIHPKDAVKANIKTFKKQIEELGISFDWNREFSTTDPEYYKWTQWQFLKFYEHGMAYKAKKNINWCPTCKTGLSNEDSAGGVCERCGSQVYQKEKEQWLLRMSDYAEDLIQGLDDTNFSDRVKIGQINWIGKSKGAEIDFKIGDENLTVYTTRPDTIYGVTFMVIAPEHPLIEKLSNKITNMDEIKKYQEFAKTKSELERTELSKEKTGVEIKGIKAINPVTKKEIPIWIADYVLASYGTGAIMAVPAHDERDFEFAKTFDLEIIPVLAGGDVTKEAFTEDGEHINSDFLNGLNKQEAIDKMVAWLEENGVGKKEVSYRLRDWLFSRQRYWGEPIPIIHWEDGTTTALSEEELPLRLPKADNIKPSGTGESPLANITDWVNVVDPKTGLKGRRETNTMPQWAGSSWYFLRYVDPHNKQALADYEKLKQWLPVDIYIGGAEHAVLHLLYARFWHKFLYDLGVVPTKEPFQKLFNQGMILGENNEKMSKSRGNVVNPDDVVKQYGADTLRLYEMFMGPLDASIAWSENGLEGSRKFLDRVWRLIVDENGKLRDRITTFNDGKLDKVYNQTVKKVTEDFENLHFNTAISQMMVFVNEAYKADALPYAYIEGFVQLLAPIAPHIAEELWEILGNEGGISYVPWPTFDEAALVESEVEIVCQINGKVRAKLMVPVDSSKEALEELALANEQIKEHIADKTVRKVIAVPNKLVNIVAN